jgi:biotin carboxylase
VKGRQGTCVVVYDRGAASAMEIIESLSGLGPLLFVVPETLYTASLLPLIQDVADVVVTDFDANTTHRAVASRGRPAAIVTYSERMLPFTAELAALLDLPFHSVDTVRVLTNKAAQRRRLADRGVDTVRFQIVDDPLDLPHAAATVGLPAVVKPIVGEGSRDVHLLTDHAMCEQVSLSLNPRNGAFLVEEFLQGGPNEGPFADYVSVETAVLGDQIHHVAVSGKFPLVAPFRESGQFWPAALDPDRVTQVRTLARQAIQALGVTSGLLHTEIKLCAAGPRIIEVNGRLGGWINDLATRSGVGDLISLSVLPTAVGTRHLKPPKPGVFFQYNNMAPATPATLLSVTGADRVRRVPGVTTYRSFIRPGTRVDGGIATNELDFLAGHTQSFDSMIECIERSIRALRFQFVLDGETVAWQPTHLGATPP